MCVHVFVSVCVCLRVWFVKAIRITKILRISLRDTVCQCQYVGYLSLINATAFYIAIDIARDLKGGEKLRDRTRETASSHGSFYYYLLI